MANRPNGQQQQMQLCGCESGNATASRDRKGGGDEDGGGGGGGWGGQEDRMVEGAPMRQIYTQTHKETERNETPPAQEENKKHAAVTTNLWWK